jgi:hypothetical protein
MIKSAEVATQRYIDGRNRTPFIPCPICNRKTNAIYKNTCRWCGSEWTEEQLKERENKRMEIIESLK